MRPATPLWKVFGRASGAVALVFALLIGVLAVFGDDAPTDAAVAARQTEATRDAPTSTSTVPITTTTTSAPLEAAPLDGVVLPPATANRADAPATAQPVTAPADPGPLPAGPAPPLPPPPISTPKVQVSGTPPVLTVSITGFPPGAGVVIECFRIDESSQAFYVTTTPTATDGSGAGTATCAIPAGNAKFVYAEASGAHSNHLRWS